MYKIVKTLDNVTIITQETPNETRRKMERF